MSAKDAKLYSPFERSQIEIADRYLDHHFSLDGRLVDPVSGFVTFRGDRKHLRRKELEVLALLASANGKMVTRGNFIAVVWQGNVLVGDRGLSSTIGFLRQSLDDSDPDKPLIRTIPRRGYQLAMPVQEPLLPNTSLAPELLTPGATVLARPGWRLIRCLGNSAASESWLAEPSEFGERSQGLRVFRFCRTEAHLQRLRREVTLQRYLHDALEDHPYFAAIRDWQLDEPPYFLARDYTQFGNMKQWGGFAALPLASRILMMQGLCDAIASMHALGAVHGNLSVDTILVDTSVGGPGLKVSGFDAGTLVDRSVLAPLGITAAGLTQDGDNAAVNPTIATDVYALGVVLLKILFGDLEAQSDSDSLRRISEIHGLQPQPLKEFQSVLTRCYGPAGERPSVDQLTKCVCNLVEDPYPIAKAPSDRQSPAGIDGTAESQQRNQKDRAEFGSLRFPEGIGGYRLVDSLGEGGMGSVYLAEQREPYRRVALKIVRTGFHGKEILGRFGAERQALAMMNHPNVAAAFDSGMATDGRPFFVMEYVAGEDITSYCDAHRLGISARIRLFLQVCDGVLHAHQKGVLHRDIKPSNLMVSRAVENAGTVKVIDFGLAKSLHGKLSTQTLQTSFGSFVGTPIYCSPEQVRGGNSGVDTRSDIYSMGVVLYEMLAGATPIPSDTLANLEPEEVRELICKSKLPSMRQQVQSASAEQRAIIAEHRSVNVDDLPKALDGDLSWVVGKCLERDPDDRYASVLELKKDLQRWLEMRPVEARATTAWYRLRKLIKRNRVAAALTAVASVVLLSTTTAAVLGFARAKQAAHEAKDFAEQAELASKFQERQWKALLPQQLGDLARADVEDGLHKSIDSAELDDPQRQRIGREIVGLLNTVNFTDIAIHQLREGYFKPALTEIAEHYRDKPRLQARLWHSIANTMLKLGALDLALEAQNKAIASRQQTLGPGHRLTLESVQLRGEIYSWLGEQSLAIQDLETAAKGLQLELGADDPTALLATYRLIDERDGSQSSIKELERILAMRVASHGEDDYWALRMRNSIAYRKRLVSPSDASASLQFVLDRAKSIDPERRELRAEALSVLAQQALDHGKTEAALTYYRQSIDASRRTAARVYFVSSVGRILVRLGRAEEAESVVRETLVEWQKLYGENNPWGLWISSELATIIAHQGRLNEAEEILRRTISRYPPTHRDRWGPLLDFARVLSAQGKLDAAEKMLKESQQLVLVTFGRFNQKYALLEHDLAIVKSLQGDHISADKMLISAMETYRKSGISPDSSSLKRDLGLVMFRLRRYDEAKSLLGSLKGPRSLQYLADVHRELGEADQAIKLNQQSVTKGRSRLHPRNPILAELLSSQAQTQAMLDQRNAAIASMQEALQIIRLGKIGNSMHGSIVRQGCLAVQSKFSHSEKLDCN